MLRVGAWCVNPAAGQISRDGETARVEARTMRLLLCLAEHAGEVVSIDDLLNQVWPGISVSPDSVYQAVASLRRLLGDDPKQPTYIATCHGWGTGWWRRLVRGRNQRRTANIRPASQEPPELGSGWHWPPLYYSTERFRAAIARLRPRRLRSHRDPSPCCRFST